VSIAQLISWNYFNPENIHVCTSTMQLLLLLRNLPRNQCARTRMETMRTIKMIAGATIGNQCSWQTSFLIQWWHCIFQIQRFLQLNCFLSNAILCTVLFQKCFKSDCEIWIFAFRQCPAKYLLCAKISKFLFLGMLGLMRRVYWN